jgi:ATP-dependent protease Clp ATPase subunit
MESMNITSAQYHNNPIDGQQDSIVATIDGTVVSVPLQEGNRHYDEIMRQVNAGELTIADAE